VGGVIVVGPQDAQAADQRGEFRRGEGEELGAVDEELLRADARCGGPVGAEAVDLWLQVAEAVDVGLLLAGVGAAWVEGDGEAGDLFDGGVATQDDEVGEGDLLRRGGLNLLEGGEDLAELLGVVDFPVLLGREADAGTVGAAALVSAAEGRGRGPGGADELGVGEAGLEEGLLQVLDVGLLDERVVDRRHGVLPDELLLGDLGA